MPREHIDTEKNVPDERVRANRTYYRTESNETGGTNSLYIHTNE